MQRGLPLTGVIDSKFEAKRGQMRQKTQNEQQTAGARRIENGGLLMSVSKPREYTQNRRGNNVD